jgi:hypothetical protein
LILTSCFWRNINQITGLLLLLCLFLVRITRPVGFFLSARMPQRQSCNNPLKGPLSLSNGNEPSCRHTEYDHKSSQSRKQLKAPRKLSRDGRDLFVLSCSKDFSPFLFYFFLLLFFKFFIIFFPYPFCSTGWMPKERKKRNCVDDDEDRENSWKKRQLLCVCFLLKEKLMTNRWILLDTCKQKCWLDGSTGRVETDCWWNLKRCRISIQIDTLRNWDKALGRITCRRMVKPF